MKIVTCNFTKSHNNNSGSGLTQTFLYLCAQQFKMYFRSFQFFFCRTGCHETSKIFEIHLTDLFHAVAAFTNKPVFLFCFFPCCCFALISKAATTKNRQFIYDYSMLCLGLELNIYFSRVLSLKKIFVVQID
jgi:hypothetical protein